MCDFNKLMGVLQAIAPFELSQKMIERGSYDNSGVIIKCHNNAKGILFSLDLTDNAVQKAVELGMDTIITHHPAIYMPIKSLSIEDNSAVLVKAIKSGINVISCHLNLDIANGGIDECMMQAVGGSNPQLIEQVEGLFGYGRQYDITEITLGELEQIVKQKFETDKVVVYGSKSQKIKTVASFCGAGGAQATSASAQVVITSDMPHHVIKELIERGKCVILLPHYASENYGFKRFYKSVSQELGVVKTYYLEDQRFL